IATCVAPTTTRAHLGEECRSDANRNPTPNEVARSIRGECRSDASRDFTADRSPVRHSGYRRQRDLIAALRARGEGAAVLQKPPHRRAVIFAAVPHEAEAPAQVEFRRLERHQAAAAKGVAQRKA